MIELPVQAVFLLLLVASAVFVMTVRDLLVAVVVFSVFSFLAAFVYALMNALDVAFIEAVIGVFTTAFFVSILYRTTRRASRWRVPREVPAEGKEGRTGMGNHMRAAAALALVLVGALFVYASAELPLTGDPASPPATHVSPRYIEEAYHETGTPNLVTAVLADYRGYDTLGETVVIFTAGMAAILILTATSLRRGGGAGAEAGTRADTKTGPGEGERRP